MRRGVTLLVVVLAAAPMAAALALGAYRSGAYSGPTEQHHRMIFKVSHGTVTGVTWGEEVTCTRSPAADYIDGPFHGKIGKDGKFTITNRSSGVIKVTGSLNGKTATGTFSDTFSPASGDVCKTGTLHWNARAG
jgi:hypothetical protein